MKKEINLTSAPQPSLSSLVLCNCPKETVLRFICPRFISTLKLVKRSSPDLMAGHLNPTPSGIKSLFTISCCSEFRASGI